MIVLRTRKGQGCEYALKQGLCHHLPVSRDVEKQEIERLDREIAAMRKEMEAC